MPLYFTVIQYSFTTFKFQSKLFKYFNITPPYSFLFTKNFGEYLLPGKANPRSIYFLGNYDWEVDICL